MDGDNLLLNEEREAEVQEPFTSLQDVQSRGIKPRMLSQACAADRPDIVQWLLDAGVTVEYHDLLSAIGRDYCLALLLTKSPDLLHADHGWTLLHSAALIGCEKSCQILIKAGCPLDSLTAKFETPLNLAICNKRQDVVKLLISRARHH